MRRHGHLCLHSSPAWQKASRSSAASDTSCIQPPPPPAQRMHVPKLSSDTKSAGALLRLLLGVTVMALAPVAFAQVPSLADVEYARVNQQPLRLDLYLPDAPQAGRPLVLFVHGGGWSGGAKFPIAAGMLPLLQQGIALASVQYRLVNSQDAALYGGQDAVIFPAAVHDVKAALRFLRANAQTYGLDAGRFGLWGSSAGGHLATLTALSDGDLQLEGSVGTHLGVSSAVQLVVDAYGPTDLLRMGVDATLAGFDSTTWDAPFASHANFIGCGSQGMGAILNNLDNPAAPWPQCVARVQLANPILHLNAADPPVWIGHATNDPVVPWTQSQRLFDALQANAVPATFVRTPSGGHSLQEAQYAQARSFIVERFASVPEAPLFQDGFEAP